MIVETSESLPLYTAVSIEHDDNLFLGEVLACAAAASGEVKEHAFRIEVKIEQILTGLHSLMALRSQLLGERIAPALTLVPVGVLN